MTGGEDAFQISLGVEEELFLVDPESRDLLSDPDRGIFEECAARSGEHKVVPEFRRTQIETNTRVCGSVAEACEALRETRRLVIEAAANHGAAALATSTHPFAAWDAQLVTSKERYERFSMVFQESIRRFLASGMHVHAGFGDPDSRIRVMTALRRYLPVLHALSTSSPFNGGRDTGFKSHRLSLYWLLNRVGLPRPMASRAEFDQLVHEYQRMEFITDGSEIWWDVRPSHAHPTIEMRICDICTRVEDAACMLALYASLLRYLSRLDREGALPPEPPTEIIAENRWLAQRYGVFAFLGDTRNGGRSDIADEVETLVETLTEDARALACEEELRHALRIIREGSSADRQLDHYRLRLVEGDSEPEALRAVVDLMIAETKAGLEVS